MNVGSAVNVSEGVTPDVRVGVALVVRSGVGLVVSVGVASLGLVDVGEDVCAGVIDAESVAVGVPDAIGDGDSVGAAVAIVVGEEVGVAIDVGVELDSGELDAVGTTLGVGVALSVTVGLAVADGEIVADDVAEAVGDAWVADKIGVAVKGARVTVSLGAAEAVDVDSGVALAAGGVNVGVCDGEAGIGAVSVADAVTVTDGVAVEVVVADGLAVCATVAVNVSVGVGLASGVGLALAGLAGVDVGEGVAGANANAPITITISAALRRRSPFASCCAQVATEKTPSIAPLTSADVSWPSQSASARRSCAPQTPADDVTVATRTRTSKQWWRKRVIRTGFPEMPGATMVFKT